MTASPPKCQPKVEPVRQHSSLPWELSPQGYIIPTHQSPMAMLKLKSPWIEGAWDDDPEAAANAAFIVEAVNGHAALRAKVDELTRALREILNLSEDLTAGEPLLNIIDAIDQLARAALAVNSQDRGTP